MIYICTIQLQTEYMESTNGTIVLDTTKLNHSLTLKSRAIQALAGMPNDIEGSSLSSAFIQSHTEYDTAKGLQAVQNMVYVRNISDVDMLVKFETWCESVKQNKAA